ncbi:MAG: pseudouridine synthase [Deltaproteobacteria bacterium]|nr:pseudouridine synthase [Deltaproteobacteria bacterium]
MADGERLQKVLARGGIASRREAERLIAAGKVSVNGVVVTTLGTRVDPAKDLVEVDGRTVEAQEKVYYLFHKPRGVVTTLTDPEGRPSIREFVEPLGTRIFPVGRLDFHTSGALLLTNDGALTNALLHPRESVAKTYVCKVRGVPSDDQIESMRAGVVLAPSGDDDSLRKTAPAEVEVLRSGPSGEDSVRDDGTTWMRITLREGRNRQIHRMSEAVGLFVMRLARISFAGLSTSNMRAGELRPLQLMERKMLLRTYLGIDEEVPREVVEPTRSKATRGPVRGRAKREDAAPREDTAQPKRREFASKTGAPRKPGPSTTSGHSRSSGKPGESAKSSGPSGKPSPSGRPSPGGKPGLGTKRTSPSGKPNPAGKSSGPATARGGRDVGKPSSDRTGAAGPRGRRVK